MGLIHASKQHPSEPKYIYIRWVGAAVSLTQTQLAGKKPTSWSESVIFTLVSCGVEDEPWSR